ncbi:hypothetical protein ACE38W_10055 [Chitinophaga sp. Hz27]|uniref:hypothetical protein n=1 Tax=Chitinophaga sp. Hz27 TaxID=3347169 RepID=UPI0035E2524E
MAYRISKWAEVKVVYILDGNNSTDLANVLETIWLAFDNVKFYFLLNAEVGQLKIDLVNYPISTDFLRLNTGYCIWHSGDEETMLSIEKSSKLDIEDFYTELLKAK